MPRTSRTSTTPAAAPKAAPTKSAAPAKQTSARSTSSGAAPATNVAPSPRTAKKQGAKADATAKETAKDVTAKETAKDVTAKETAKDVTAKDATAKDTAKHTTARDTAKAPGRGRARGGTDAFLDAQRAALLAERGNYVQQADELKAQADSLALEHEPGDVQFDEEGGEGGTSNVDRELDLLLSSQARGAVEEIDRALAKIDAGTYGRCEQCGQQIPEARLEALPHASLCVVCKAGGLSSRR